MCHDLFTFQLSDINNLNVCNLQHAIYVCIMTDVAYDT